MKSYNLVTLGIAFTLAGCVDAAKEGQEGQEGPRSTHYGESGLELTIAVDGSIETDVARMRYGIDRVACYDGEKFEALNRDITVELERMLLPGGIAAFENSPLNKSSEHQFADHFEVLPAGCYDVGASPLAKDGVASADCASARAQGIEVLDGWTTEVFLISQCKGAAVGALDTVVALNQPPQLETMEYIPSKFIAQGETATVCATVMDPNGDPVEMVWSRLGSAACEGPKVISSARHENRITECVAITPAEVDKYWFDVRAYDLLHDETGAKIRFEQWLRDHGYPNESHDSLAFPLYVGEAATVEIGTSN